MTTQIIKQPDGLYALWSSIVDDFTMFDATPDDIAEEWANEAARKAREGVHRIVAGLEAGRKPYYQFTMTWEEALERRAEVHGVPFNIEAARTHAAYIEWDKEKEREEEHDNGH